MFFNKGGYGKISRIGPIQAKLNGSNHLSKGIVFAVPGYTNMDIVGTVNVLQANGPLRRGGARGMAWRSNGGAEGVPSLFYSNRAAFAKIGQDTSNPGTFAVVATTEDITKTCFASCCAGGSFGVSGTPNGWGWGYLAAADGGGLSGLGVFYARGTTYVRAIISETPALSSPFTFVSTFDGSNDHTIVKNYLNGQLGTLVGGTDGAGSVSTTNQSLELCTRRANVADTGQNHLGLIFNIIVSNRIWSDAEVMSFHRDPYQMYKSTTRSTFLFFSSTTAVSADTRTSAIPFYMQRPGLLGVPLVSSMPLTWVESQVANTVLSLAGATSNESPGALTALASLLLAGAQSNETSGAASLSALLSLAGKSSDEAVGALSLVSSLLLAGAFSSEFPGAETLSALSQLSGGLSSELSGAISLLSSLSLSGGSSEERAGAVTILSVTTLLLAGAYSSERAGASTMSQLFALAGGLSSESSGAQTISALLTQSSGLSSEAGGAAKVIAGLITLLLSSGQSSESAAASTLAAINTLTGGSSSETPGSSSLSALLTQVAGLSSERTGALIAALQLSLSSGVSSEHAGSLTVQQQALVAEVHRMIRGAVGPGRMPTVRGKPH